MIAGVTAHQNISSINLITVATGTSIYLVIKVIIVSKLTSIFIINISKKIFILHILCVIFLTLTELFKLSTVYDTNSKSLFSTRLLIPNFPKVRALGICKLPNYPRKPEKCLIKIRMAPLRSR